MFLKDWCVYIQLNCIQIKFVDIIVWLIIMYIICFSIALFCQQCNIWDCHTGYLNTCIHLTTPVYVAIHCLDHVIICVERVVYTCMYVCMFRRLRMVTCIWLNPFTTLPLPCISARCSDILYTMTIKAHWKRQHLVGGQRRANI